MKAVNHASMAIESEGTSLIDLFDSTLHLAFATMKLYAFVCESLYTTDIRIKVEAQVLQLKTYRHR